MSRKLMLKTMLVAVLLLGGAVLAQAIPGYMTIGGRLLDQSGNPVTYPAGETALAARIDFYDSQTATTPFTSLPVTAKAFNGYFSIQFVPPEAMLLKDKVWYALAIDADRNGLTSSDVFPDRSEIGSVPFALSAKPQHNFTTFGGRKDNGMYSSLPANIMFVAPFETPAGGIEFNQMNIFVTLAGRSSSFSVGIYDGNGVCVANTGLIQMSDTVSIHDSFLQAKVPQTKLQSASIYYVGMARRAISSSEFVAFPNGLIPVAPVFGTVNIGTVNGQVPASFNPASINPNSSAHVVPVTLIQSDTEAKGAGWKVDKASGSAWRWIPSKGKKTDSVYLDAQGKAIK